MEYYTIILSPGIHYMMVIVTEFGKFRYNHLYMVMCASGDIFQAKLNKLPGDIKSTKTYVDDILVLRN